MFRCGDPVLIPYRNTKWHNTKLDPAHAPLHTFIFNYRSQGLISSWWVNCWFRNIGGSRDYVLSQLSEHRAADSKNDDRAPTAAQKIKQLKVPYLIWHHFISRRNASIEEHSQTRTRNSDITPWFDAIGDKETQSCYWFDGLTWDTYSLSRYLPIAFAPEGWGDNV